MTAPAGCGYLHNAFGPGCPYCTEATGGATAHALAAEADLIKAGLTKAERKTFLAAWDKPAADLTEAEVALLDRHYGAVA